MSQSRRSFLGTAITAAALSPLLATGKPASLGNQKPGRIIHLVSDGMSVGTLTCADHLSRRLRKRPLSWLDWQKRPGTHMALMDMRSQDSLVTDSAAAAASWGSGSRVANGALNVLPDGRNLQTLYALFRQAGWKRGLVTTTEITHATPAGFSVNVGSRGSADDIALQYFDRQIDLLLGGGRMFFDKRKDKRNLLEEFRTLGYEVLLKAADLNSASRNKRWLGVFAQSHLPFTIDQQRSDTLKAEVPTLAALTRAALDRFENEKNFILQVEGGRVDHACHACDAAGAFNDQIAFDEALAVCLEFQEKHPETLIVATTDHGNGNPGLNGMGANYRDSDGLFGNLARVKCSFEQLVAKSGFREIGKRNDPNQVAAVIAEETGYKIPERKLAQVVDVLAGKSQMPFDHMSQHVTLLGQLLANHLGVGWAGNAHTSDHVLLNASGPGAERFHGFVRNTDVFYHYLAFAGIDHKNPTVPERV